MGPTDFHRFMEVNRTVNFLVNLLKAFKIPSFVFSRRNKLIQD